MTSNWFGVTLTSIDLNATTRAEEQAELLISMKGGESGMPSQLCFLLKDQKTADCIQEIALLSDCVALKLQIHT